MNNFQQMQERRERLHLNTETLANAFLEHSKDGKGYICPSCTHGKGTAKKGGQKNPGDGITFSPEGKWHCFGCGKKGDIIDLYQLTHGIGYPEAIEQLEGLLGVAATYTTIRTTAPKDDKKKPEQVKAEFNALTSSPLTAEFRGLSVETLTRYGGRGYKEFKNPLIAGTYHGPRPAVAFPTSDGCFFVRALKPKEGERTDKWDIGGKRPFNLEALKGRTPVFVVEGVIDALSIIEAGGEAIGLSGTEGIDAFVEALKNVPSPNGLLLAPDNDKRGAEAGNNWKAKLEAVGVECDIVDVSKLYAGAKDANEALVKDRDSLKHRIAEEYASRMQIFNPWGAGVSDLVDAIASNGFKPIPTGIKIIDNLLGGGLIPKQLAVIGAAPGMGKTSLCQQIAESLISETPEATCLYICFEMSREQLQARSVSRLLNEYGQDVSPLEIMQGKLGWREGVNLYKQQIAERVAYFGLGSGLHSSKLEEMLGIMRAGVKYNAAVGRPAPIVFVDYLQLIDSGSTNEADSIKVAMASLKEFAVKNQTVVVGIVANNRESNKSGGVSMYAGRGSSAIEYGADIVLGLAYTELLDNENLEKPENKNKRSLVITKGRFCGQDERADFDFDGKHSHFRPISTWGKPASDKDNKVFDDLVMDI